TVSGQGATVTCCDAVPDDVHAPRKSRASSRKYAYISGCTIKRRQHWQNLRIHQKASSCENSCTCGSITDCWTRTVCRAGYQAEHEDYPVHRGKNSPRGKRAAFSRRQRLYLRVR